MKPWPATTTNPSPLVQLVVCAASPARHTPTLVRQLHQIGWQVQVIATPNARIWFDHEQLRRDTNRPVISGTHHDGEIGTPDLVLVAPATFHTVNMLAAGTNDSMALSSVHLAIGRRTPVVLAPHVNADLNRHPLTAASHATLTSWGVEIISDGMVCEGGCGPDVHWSAAIAHILRRLHDGLVR